MAPAIDLKKVTAEELKAMRPKMLGYLAANCKCSKEKTAYNDLNDRTLAVLVNEKAEGSNADATGSGSVQAGGEEDNDDGAGGGFEGMPEDKYKSKKGKGLEGSTVKKVASNAREQWLASAPADVRETLNAAQEIVAREKNGIVAKLTANVRDPNQKKTIAANLLKKELPELRELASLMPAQPRQPVDNETGNYGPVGLGGISFESFTGNEDVANAAGDYDASDDSMSPPTLNFAKVSAENSTRKSPPSFTDADPVQARVEMVS